MNKFLVVLITSIISAMVLLNTLVAAEIDFTVPLYADFTLQLPTGSGLPLNLDVVASSVVSLHAKSLTPTPSNTVADIKEEINTSCRLKISPQLGGTFSAVKIIDLGGSGTIVEGAPVSIKFVNMQQELNYCKGSPVWQVVDGAVQTGGTLGKDRFKIIRVNQDLAAGITGAVYKIQSCSTSNTISITDYSCQDLGLSLDPVTANTIVTTTRNPHTSPLHVQIKPVNN